MKKLVLIPALFLLSSMAFAGGANLVASDDSPYTAICIAAVESEAAMFSKMAEFNVSRYDISDLSCNGVPLNRFASKHSEVDSPKAVKVFAFRQSASNNETSLCIAAATSNEEYYRTRDALFSNAASDVSDINCNNMPLRTFARRYGNAEFKI